MSVEAMAMVLNHSKATGTAKLVLIGIANHLGDGGAWPAMTTLARYGAVSVRQARRAVRTLEALGEVRVILNKGGTIETADDRRPNRYEVLVGCPPWCDRTTQHRDMRRREQGVLPVEKRTDTSDRADTSDRGDRTPVTERADTDDRLTVLEPPNEHTSVVQDSTTERAGADQRPCADCGLSRAECMRRAATSGHTYVATQRRHEGQGHAATGSGVRHTTGATQ